MEDAETIKALKEELKAKEELLQSLRENTQLDLTIEEPELNIEGLNKVKEWLKSYMGRVTRSKIKYRSGNLNYANVSLIIESLVDSGHLERMSNQQLRVGPAILNEEKEDSKEEFKKIEKIEKTGKIKKVKKKDQDFIKIINQGKKARESGLKYYVSMRNMNELYIAKPFDAKQFGTYDVLVSLSGKIKIQFYKGNSGQFLVRKKGKGNERTVTVRGALIELGIKISTELHGFYPASRGKTYVVFNINEKVDSDKE